METAKKNPYDYDHYAAAASTARKWQDMRKVERLVRLESSTTIVLDRLSALHAHEMLEAASAAALHNVNLAATCTDDQLHITFRTK